MVYNMAKGKIRRSRGAIPTPRHKLAAARPYQYVRTPPSQFAWGWVGLSYWGNDQYGDCVTAEEAFAKSVGASGILVPDAVVQSWACANGFLNGADLSDVLNAMETGGFPINGSTYNDGPATSVDWTNPTVLQAAIIDGPVKIGVAADQLESVVGTTNGWFLVGASPDGDEDHCVSLAGYGPMSWLAERLGVSVPAGVDGLSLGYLLFTWDTVGIIDASSMLEITGEAWVRHPTTVIDGPAPTPTPVPPPGPTPTPAPSRRRYSGVFTSLAEKAGEGEG